MDKIYTKKEIIHQLEQMNAPRNSVVLMHSSLRAIGSVENGAEGLLDVLISYFTAQGGLFCVPTHTWDNLDSDITLDVLSDRQCLGAFSSVAIRDPRGVRSLNPTHSMVVFGDRERALDFVKGELYVDTPTSPDSCYGKLIDRCGMVLLVGVCHNKNTLLHTIDEMLCVPNRMEEKYTPVLVVDKDGERHGSKMRLFYTDYIEDISLRFPKYETAFRYHGCIQDGFIGNAPVQLCDAQKMKKTVELIYRHSSGIDPLKDEEAIPQKWYCKEMD